MESSMDDMSLVLQHGGEGVHDLADKLKKGILSPSDVPALVAAKHRGIYWVVFGNRHLKTIGVHAVSQEVPRFVLQKVLRRPLRLASPNSGSIGRSGWPGLPNLDGASPQAWPGRLRFQRRSSRQRRGRGGA